MWKDFLIVSIGSFFGGGMRFLISKAIQTITVIPFPFGTLAVNVLGCLVFGFLSGLSITNGGNGGAISATTKLLLTTGFCGGFTTFSTFMNESSALFKEEHFIYMAVYVVSSLALGFLAIVAGHEAAKLI